jgi:hypothetical protein
MSTGFRATTRGIVIRELGVFCAFCGSSSLLAFDTIHAEEFCASRTAPDYQRAFLDWNLQVLCHACNALKGHDGIPFPWVSGVDILPVHFYHERAQAIACGASAPWVWAAYDYGIDFTLRRGPYRKRKK